MRRIIFVDAYISNKENGTQAAIMAGFSAKTAGVQATKLLKEANVQQMIAERRRELVEKSKLTTDELLIELAKIVRADLRTLFNEDGSLKSPKDWPDEVAGAVAGMEIDELFDGVGKDRIQIGMTKKLKLWDKNSAIEKAMKHLGLFKEDNSQQNKVMKIIVPAKEAPYDPSRT